MKYYLSWYCIKVVLSYQTVECHEEVVCNTGNILSQDTRYCLYWYTRDVIQYMREHERCTLRIYIGSVDKMEDVIAVDFRTGRDEDGEYEVVKFSETSTQDNLENYVNIHWVLEKGKRSYRNCLLN